MSVELLFKESRPSELLSICEVKTLKKEKEKPKKTNMR